MGAPTSNRKRGSDYNFLPFHPPKPGIDAHIPKKLKYTLAMENPVPDPPKRKSVVSRFFQYPKEQSQIRREVQAPPRRVKFGSFRASRGQVSSRDHLAKSETIASFSNYEQTKEEEIRSLRFVEKGKEVIDVDDYDEKDRESHKHDVEDSSIEEVEIVKNGKDLRIKEVEIVENGKCDRKLMELDGNIGELNVQRSGSSVVSEDLAKPYLKSERARKVLDLVPTDGELGSYDEPVYKMLHDSASKRDNRLGGLNFLIGLNLKYLSRLRLSRAPTKPKEVPTTKPKEVPTTKPKEDVVREPFVPLSKEEEDEVARALSNAKRRKVLVTHEHSNIEITGELLQCLKPGAWLNDEVINLYLELLKERERREPHKFLKCHFFNTFFYKKLRGGKNGYDFKSVRRWTTQRKLGYCLNDCDKIFVPIHKEIHWCLAVINKKDEKFQYLDSLKGVDEQVMKVLAKYFVEEVNDKIGKSIDVSSWKQEYVEDLPEQLNGFDCGMFMIKYADFYSRDMGLCFSQEHMPYFRRRTAKEILRLKAE